MKAVNLSTLVFLAALSVPPAPAQDWTQLFPTTSPGGRRTHAMAYDWGRQRTVLFGGRDAAGNRGDTWEWDGQTWAQMNPANSPPARWYLNMAYDLARSRVLLFGGANGGNLGDTWEWDGVDWTRRTPANSPSARYRHMMAYDMARQRVVLFGGNPGSRPMLNDTWEWDGNDWTRMNPTNVPPVRISDIMVYDMARQRTVLHGGYDWSVNGESLCTWEWDGVDWTERTPVTVPSKRFSHIAAYDQQRQRVVMHGGRFYGVNSALTSLGDTWEWTGEDWIETTPPGSPSDRYIHAMAYDMARRQIVIHGGDGNIDETWVYQAGGSFGIFGQACAGSAGLPALRRGLVPAVNQPFQILFSNLPANRPGLVFTGTSRTVWAGLPLPLDLGGLGMPGCSLYIDGLISVGVLSDGAGAAAWGLTLPNDPNLAGFDFFNQGFFIDPTGNAAGLIATNASQSNIGS